MYVIAASCACLTASSSANRTSTRPSACGRIDPTTTASAPRARKSANFTSSARRRPRHDPGVAHLPEEAASLQIGGDDAGDAERPGRLVLERDDRDGDRGAGAADDFDGELRARRRDGQDHEREGGENQSAQCGPWQGEAAMSDYNGPTAVHRVNATASSADDRRRR